MNVAFLANTYHLTKTRSSQFFIDLLTGWFGPISVIAHQDAWAKLPGTSWDLLISWQHLFPPAELEAFGAKTTILVPMYDDCPKDRDFWIRYRRFRILCFSSSLADLLYLWGLECHRVTYWPPVPTQTADWKDGLKGFFWPRTDALDWRQVGVLTGETRWESFHLHVAHSPPSVVLPEASSVSASRFVRSEWFEGPHAYQAALAECNVFFAPRRFEGIGMANLEALALGLCVVAPDCPTANEYIIPGVNGYLFDPDNPKAIAFTGAKECGSRARQGAIEGRKRWEASLPELRMFLERAHPGSRRFHPWIVVRGRGRALLRSAFRAVKLLFNRGQS